MRALVAQLELFRSRGLPAGKLDRGNAAGFESAWLAETRGAPRTAQKCGNELTEVVKNRGRVLKIGAKTNSERTKNQAQICANRTRKGTKAARYEQYEVRAFELRGGDEKGQIVGYTGERPFVGVVFVGCSYTPRNPLIPPAPTGESAIAGLSLYWPA